METKVEIIKEKKKKEEQTLKAVPLKAPVEPTHLQA